jgi:putative membrane protein
VVTSEGNNFESSRIAKVFAQELGHDVNETLNERRWKLVLSSAAGSQHSVERLREGVDQLRAGARELTSGAAQTASGARATASGSGRLGDGIVQLTRGVKQLGTGLKTMEANRAHTSDLNRLKAGADELAAGQGEMDKGIHELKTGSTRLRDGVSTFREDAKSSLLVPSSVGDGLDQVHNGVVQIETGLEAATVAQQKLTAGAQSVATGVEALTGGMRAMTTGVRTMVAKLPADSQLDELETGAVTLVSATAAVADGTLQIKTGTDRLTAGLELLEGALPVQIEKPDGSAQGLAVSVVPQVEIDASVANNGSGFAPNVIPAALWLGAGIAAFLIHVRVLPRHAQFFSRPAQTLGKFAVPGSIVLMQAALVLATVLWVLHIQIVHLGAFTLTLAVASLTFLAIVFALTRAFGDAGKALAMIFLAVQLSSSGGILPVELSGGLFANISPWLPLTWVVRALKASMFNAYGGAWQHPLAIVALGGSIVMACACWIGRWRFVMSASMRPAVDF